MNPQFVWPHRDVSGRIIGEIRRFVPGRNGKPKEDIPFYRFDGRGFVPGIPDTMKSVGYPLFGIETVADKNTMLIVVEGQKSQAAFAGLGFPCVTSLLGANNAHLTNWKSLEGIRSVSFCPDNDGQGEIYIKTVWQRLKHFQCPPEMQVIRLPGLPAKGDICDWLKQQPELDAWDELKSLAHHPQKLILQERLHEAIKDHLHPVPTEWAQPHFSKQDHDDLWEDPIPFDEIEAPEIPTRLLPGVLGEFAAALATATEVPEALAVMTVLGVVAAATTKRFVVTPKDGWLEPVNIYTLIALPPANNKTQVFNHCTEPLVAWEREQASLLESDIKRQRSERKSQEKIIEALRLKAAKEKDAPTQKELIGEIADMEAGLMEPQALPQLFANDTTPEALANNIHEQGGRFAIFSDEGGIVETMSGLYTGGTANVDILLKGIDGGHVRIRRRDRNFDLNPFLTIVLTVQPVIIQNMKAKKAFTGNGMLERFLFVLPKSRLGYRTHDKPPVPAHIRLAYQRKIRALLDTPPCMENGEERPRVLTLSPEALQEWRDFQAAIETQLRPDGRLSACLGSGGKICGFALRIAGLLHVSEYGESRLVISGDTMARALEIAALLTEHALAAYGLMGSDETIEDSKEVFRWIVAQGKPSFTQTEVTSAMRHKKLGKSERLAKALTVLMDRNLISEPEKMATRKPTTYYRVHPEILKGEE